MADEKKPSYPFVNRKNWFILRKQFARTMPTTVSNSYVAGILDIDPDSARANVISGLKRAGLVDADNKPTPLAFRWRDDDQYAQVCDEIRQTVYPDELRDIAPDATVPVERVERWFANKLGVGVSSSGKLAQFYMLLCEADPTKETESVKTSPISAKTPKTKVKAVPAKTASNGKNSTPAIVEESVTPAAILPIPTPVESSDVSKAKPSLHIDIQIHISPESSADQIEQIFASMAKHLKEI